MVNVSDTYSEDRCDDVNNNETVSMEANEPSADESGMHNGDVKGEEETGIVAGGGETSVGASIGIENEGVDVEEETGCVDANEGSGEVPEKNVCETSLTENAVINVEPCNGNAADVDPSRRTPTPPPSYSDICSTGAKEKRDPQFIIEADVDVTHTAPESHWYSLNIDMLPCKLAYFFDQAKEASIWPYLVLFHVSSGLGPFQAGIINGIRFVGCLVGGPLWGWVADQKRIHRQMGIMICILAILFQCSQPFWAHLLGPEDKNTCPRQSNETIEEAEKRQASGEVHNENLFYTLLVISLCACFFDGTTLSFVDSGVQKRIRESPKTIDFGRQRLFGSLGYAVGSVVASAAIEKFPASPISCFAGMFCCYFTFAFLLMVSFSRLFRGKSTHIETSTSPTRAAADPKVNEIIWKTVKNGHIIFFLLTTLFNGLMRALVYSFTYLYLKELGSPTMLLGVSMIVSQAASFVFYALAEKIIDYVGGTMRVMCLSCFSWVIRLLCLAFMRNYWLILPINVLNGVSASLFVAASIIHVRKTCPPVAFTTMYGIRNSLFNGGGYILANIVGGEMYQLYGAKKLFLYTCGICAGYVTIMVIYLVKYRNTNIAVSVDPSGEQDDGGKKGQVSIELRPPS